MASLWKQMRICRRCVCVPALAHRRPNVFILALSRASRCCRARCTQAFHEYQVAETARRRDVLESELEMIRGGLHASNLDTPLIFHASHGLWELTCDQTNHKYLTYSVFDHLTHQLGHRDQRISNASAAALWFLVRAPATALAFLRRLL